MTWRHCLKLLSGRMMSVLHFSKSSAMILVERSFFLMCMITISLKAMSFCLFARILETCESVVKTGVTALSP